MEPTTTNPLDRLFVRLFQHSPWWMHLLSLVGVYLGGFLIMWTQRDLIFLDGWAGHEALVWVAIAWTFTVPLSRLPMAHGMATEPGSFDNQLPREQQARLDRGWKARARGMHNNALEAFAPFGIAVLVAQVRGGDPNWIASQCAIYVGLRLVYSALYLADIGWLRSTVFGLANGVVLVLMLHAG